MSQAAFLTIFGLIAAAIGAIAGVVQILDYLQKRRETAAERRQRPEPAAAEPAPSPSAHSAGNLPRPLTSFIGRERERDEVARLLATTRLLTLTGPGGTGKTRLALELGRDVQPGYADGVWLVELAALADPALVPQAIAATLGVREQPGRPLTETLAEQFAPKALLLILDNCEHLLTACAVLVTALLRAAPKLQVLATSRQALGVAGETVWRVPSLDAPNPQVVDSAAEVLAFDAARLFVDRAAAAQPSFAVNDRNARTVAEICRRLDGIPLALELAAARVRVLSVEQIAARLADRFRLLTGGSRAELPRQQTLRALIDWSHDLLDEQEQVLFRRTAVFAGGFTLEAAESVASGDPVEEPDVLGLLGSLVDKSLITRDDAGGSVARYRLLETIREYAAEKLDAAGETAALRDRHLRWYLGLAEQAEPRLVGAEQASWLGRLEEEHDNLRAALEWSQSDGGHTEECLRLAGALWRFWYVRGYLGEGRQWLGQALRQGAEAAPALRAKALNGAGNLAMSQGDYAAARAFHEQALAVRRQLQDERGIAASLNNLGLIAQGQGDYDRALSLYDESLALKRTLGDALGVAASLRNLGAIARMQGDYERASALYEQAVAAYRNLGDTQHLAATLSNMGVVLRAQGQYERAVALYTESLALARTLGDKQAAAAALINLGDVRRDQHDRERAAALYEESLALFRTVGDTVGMAACLEGLAATRCTEAAYECAARLYGAADALRGESGVPLPAAERAEYDRNLAAARTALGDAEFTAKWQEGRVTRAEAMPSR